MTKEQLDLINKTIDGVVARLKMDADSMDIDPRHNRKVENIVDRQRFIAGWIDKDRGDIIYEVFGVDVVE